MSTVTFLEKPQVKADTQPDQRRMTEADPDYVLLHTRTRRALMLSVRTCVRALQAARSAPVTQQAHLQSEAINSFVQRHLQLLQRAYVQGHTEGQIDYWHAVSNTRGKDQLAPADTSAL